MLSLMIVVMILGLIVPAVAEQPALIRLRDKAKHVNEMVTVQGITGKKLDDISRSTRLYTLVDDFGDSIRVRTAQPWPPIGVTFRVKGTIIYDGGLRDYVLVEAERVALGGEVRPASPARTSPNPTATAQSQRTGEEGDSDTLLVAGVGLIISAGIVLLLLASSARRRRRAELRRQQREEAERARAALAPPMPVPVPTASREGTVSMGKQLAREPEATSARGVTREAWGRLLIVDGPGVGTTYPLMGNKTIIGRDASVDVALSADDTVSKAHATLVRTNDGRVLFVDESRNGSRVNGQTVHMGQVELASGTRIEVGLTTLEFADFRKSPIEAEIAAARRQTLQVAGLKQAPGVPQAEVVVVTGPDAARRFPISRRIMTIGRLDDRDIQLTDPVVSRKHATLSFDGEAFVLQNESPNGTLVDGQSVQSIRLTGGEKIKIGETVLRVELKAAKTG